jgi:hypothetical protein
LPQFEYKTEVLTSMVGRDKLRVGDLESTLKKYGDDGWELVSLSLDADLRGSRDGHLLVFKRAKGNREERHRPPNLSVSDRGVDCGCQLGVQRFSNPSLAAKRLERLCPRLAVRLFHACAVVNPYL